jgi:hypothetical protein
MNMLQKLLNPKPATLIEVVFLRPSMINGIHYNTGDVAVVSERQAAELIGSNAASRKAEDGLAAKKLADLAAMLPPPGEPRPVPDGWESLPQCFSGWWTLNERGLLLIHRHDQITELLVNEARKYCKTGSMDSIHLGIPNRLDRDRVIQAVGLALHVGSVPQDHVDKLRYFRDAEQRAEQAVDDWRSANVRELTRLRIECSDFTQERHGELCRNIRDLHKMAFDLFNTRIAALGLGETKAKELFRGSADAIRYTTILRPDLQDLRLAWANEGESPKYYIDRLPPVMASLITGWAATGEEVTKLTRQCKSELAKASKVTNAAAA